MKKYFPFLLAVWAVLSPARAQQRDNYATPYDPATVRQDGVKAGEVLRRTFSESRIYPSTVRDYWIYIPAAYDGQTPACLYVCLDGLQYNAATVFDNLIATGEMPVTIGVFVGPGSVRDDSGKTIRYNRSNEFDRTDDTFVRFLLEELLPEVERQNASDGRPIRLSLRPEDGAIAGASSGGICAFTAAWERPDRFSRVFSAVGTYVAMRGGNEYPSVIRKTEPKALRIFLQDGLYDAWNPLFGDWFESNLLMESALNFAGYELAHTWGRGGHNNIHAARVFPDAMRWLWKGWPRGVQKGTSLNDMLAAILPETGDKDWEKIETAETARGASDLYAIGEERIAFQNDDRVYTVDSAGELRTHQRLKTGERLIGADSLSLYTIDERGTLARYRQGKRSVLSQGLSGVRQALVSSEGILFLTRCRDDAHSVLKLLPDKTTPDPLESLPNGGDYLALSPDHRLLIQNERYTRWLLSYLNDPVSGDIGSGQRFYWLHNTLYDESRQNGNMVFDRSGNLYVATRTGIQICDQNGRVRAILSVPAAEMQSIALVGNRLYALCNGNLFVRLLAVEGAQAWQKASIPPSQGQG